MFSLFFRKISGSSVVFSGFSSKKQSFSVILTVCPLFFPALKTEKFINFITYFSEMPINSADLLNLTTEEFLDRLGVRPHCCVCQEALTQINYTINKKPACVSCYDRAVDASAKTFPEDGIYCRKPISPNQFSRI